MPTSLIGAHANVVVGRPATSLLKSFYTVAGVNEENDGISTPEYKTILTEPVKVGALGTDGSSVNCEELIPYGKGGWLGLDWFSDQPSLEACTKLCDKKDVSSTNCPCNKLFKVK